MVVMEIKDYTGFKEGNKFYGGNAGHKISIIENGVKWLLKFPKSTYNLENVDMSYTSAPLSEYIGSKIYEILGHDVHETKLGIYDSKLVVACKDFTTKDYDFFELHEVKNSYLGKNEAKREYIMRKSKTSRDEVNLEELLFVLDNYEKLTKIPRIKERFWDMFVIDNFINNNDRHNGNWGILSNESGMKLAPVYDNGAGFFSKHDTNKIKKILSDEERFNQIVENGRTPYIYDGKKIDSSTVIKKLSLEKGENVTENTDLKKAVLRNIPKIELNKIFKLIDEIPEKEKGIKVMSDLEKNFYKKFLKERYEKILLPSYERIVNSKK